MQSSPNSRRVRLTLPRAVQRRRAVQVFHAPQPAPAITIAIGGRPMKRTQTTLLACGLVFASLAPVSAEPPRLPVPAFDQSAVAARGYFYVGGTYVGEPGKEIMQGQIYVEVVAPKDVRRPYPLVLIHGAAQTATNWMGTPDGRKGWTDYFVEQGYIVYMIDEIVGPALAPVRRSHPIG